MKIAFTIGLALVLLGCSELSWVMGKTKEPAQVFKPAIAQIDGKTQIQILLPSKLPWLDDLKAIKFARGEIGISMNAGRDWQMASSHISALSLAAVLALPQIYGGDRMGSSIKSRSNSAVPKNEP